MGGRDRRLFGYHALDFAALTLRPASRGEPDRLSVAAADRPVLRFAARRAAERSRHLVGAALGFAGAATLFAGKAGGLTFALAIDPRVLSGYGLALACAFVWSSYWVHAQAQSRADRSGRRILLISFLGRSPRSAISPLSLPSRRPASAQWAAIVGLGLGPVGLAFYVWDFGVKHGDIRLLGVAAYAAPVLSTLILVVAGFAPATLSLGLACALIVGGAVVATQR